VRTYVTADDPVSDHDRRYIVEAVQSRARRESAGSGLMFDFIGHLLLKQTTVTTPEESEERARFIGKFQQDHQPGRREKDRRHGALHLRPPGLAERGRIRSDAVRLEPAAVHDWMIARQRRSPSALSATSTHDTKRGEDVRARLKRAVWRFRSNGRRRTRDGAP
jgi:(1->4)-alpha-D-glucan 1-alpha-D-glucosylmutase